MLTSLAGCGGQREEEWRARRAMGEGGPGGGALLGGPGGGRANLWVLLAIFI